MGYAHHYVFKKAPKGKTKEVESTYKKAILECQKIIKAYYTINGGLSGFSAHTKLGQYGGINFNGAGYDGHENFTLREHFSQNIEDWNFCKTNRKPYDTVVVACLIVLHNRLKDLVAISSDGTTDDFGEGLKLASDVLKRKTLKIPKNIRKPLKF